ncbi:MAG: 5'-nucleotidase C-terminal domain-containing protein [Thermoflexales bacterium]|nr:5'-nucleotidase C-terminal domain-containing protein [Thermoflexales bacterium]
MHLLTHSRAGLAIVLLCAALAGNTPALAERPATTRQAPASRSAWHVPKHFTLLSGAPTSVTLKRAASGLINKPQVFTATVAPSTATTPITFTWEADEQSPVVDVVNGLVSSQAFTWTTTGAKRITVTVENADGSISQTSVLTVSDRFHLTILHTNDFHARLVPYAPSGASNCVNVITSTNVCIGGAARLSTKVKEIRAAKDNVVLLDAGDQFQGTLFYSLFKSEPIALVMNAIGYDAMAIGNHEFDDGPPELRRFIDRVNFPVLSANINASAEPSLTGKIAPSVVITVNGEPVGIVGLTTPDTANISSPGPNVVFSNVVPSAQAAVNALLAQGVNRIIALTHLGYSEDLRVAQLVTGVDVIVGGHSHTFLYTPTVPINVAPNATDNPAAPYPTVVTSPSNEPVLIVQAFQWGRYLGNLEVAFSHPTGTVVSWGGNPIFMTNTIALDPAITNLLVPTYTGAVAALQNTVVGTVTRDMPLVVGGVNICRRVECLLGNLVADAMLWKVNSTLPSGSQPYQIALQNGGGLRAPVTAITVTVGEVLELLPFGNTIATLEITGSHIITALENGLANVGISGDGRFPQVSGLRYLWDIYRPVGSRVISVEVFNPNTNSFEPLSRTARYRMVTNNFVRQGGDGYTVLRDFAIAPYDFGPALDQAVIDYIQQFSPITPTLDGRIQYLRQSLITATRTTLPADGVSTARITITLRDDLLSLMPNTPVNLFASKGTLSSNTGTTGSSGSALGQVVITLTAPTEAGTGTVFAIGGGQTLSLTFIFTQGISTVNFSPSTVTVTTGDGQTAPPGGSVVTSGNVLTYTFTVTNAGPGVAQNVLIVGTVPSGTEYISGSASGGIGPSSFEPWSMEVLPAAAQLAQSQIVFWQGSLPPGSAHTLSYAVRVRALSGAIQARFRVFMDNTELYQTAHTAEVEPSSRAYIPIVRR